MKLWLLVQSSVRGYDTFDSCVVAAPDEDSARKIPPRTSDNTWGRTWCFSPEDVHVEYLGTAKKGTTAGVVLASFNAG